MHSFVSRHWSFLSITISIRSVTKRLSRQISQIVVTEIPSLSSDIDQIQRIRDIATFASHLSTSANSSCLDNARSISRVRRAHFHPTKLSTAAPTGRINLSLSLSEPSYPPPHESQKGLIPAIDRVKLKGPDCQAQNIRPHIKMPLNYPQEVGIIRIRRVYPGRVLRLPYRSRGAPNRFFSQRRRGRKREGRQEQGVEERGKDVISAI